MAPSSIVGLPSPRTPSEPPTPPPRDDASDLLSASVFSSHWYGEDRKPLRVKGVLVKKDGSRRRSLTKVLTGRATWSERHFFLDVAAGKLSYFYDAGLARRAGVVRLEPVVSAAGKQRPAATRPSRAASWRSSAGSGVDLSRR